MNLYSRIILLLLCIEIVTTGFLVFLSFQNILSENTFAFFLAVELVAFAIVSYLFRTTKNGDSPNRPWMIVASLVIAGLFLSSILLR